MNCTARASASLPSRAGWRSIARQCVATSHKGWSRRRGPRQPRISQLRAFEPYLRQRLVAFPQLSGRRLHRELRDLGYSGGYSILTDLLREIRPVEASPFEVRFETPPGRQAQVDFAHFQMVFTDEPGVERIIWLFSMVLGHSRMLWGSFVLHQDLQTLLRCHAAAFEALGGVPEQILYDRMRTVFNREDPETSIDSRRPLCGDLSVRWHGAPMECAHRRVGECIKRGANQYLLCGALQPDARNLATGDERLARLLALAHLRPLQMLSSIARPVIHLAYANLWDYWASSAEELISLWDTRDDTTLVKDLQLEEASTDIEEDPSTGRLCGHRRTAASTASASMGLLDSLPDFARQSLKMLVRFDDGSLFCDFMANGDIERAPTPAAPASLRLPARAGKAAPVAFSQPGRWLAVATVRGCACTTCNHPTWRPASSICRAWTWSAWR